MSDTVSSDSVAQEQLQAFIERLERLEEEKKAIADDIREVKAEARGNGFDIPVLNMILKIRKQDHAERMEQEALLDLYLAALGMAPAPRDDDDGDDDPPPRGRRYGDNRRPAALDMGRASSVAKTETDRLSGEHGGQTNQESAPAVRGFSDVVTPSSGESVIGREEAEHSLPAPLQPEIATQSTAARTDAPNKNAAGHGAVNASEAGTQARPVDNDLTTGLTPTWPLTPADAGQVDLIVDPLHESCHWWSNPTPDDSGDTVEPDSGLLSSMQLEVAPIPSDLAETSMIEGEAESASGEAPDSSPPSASAPRTLAEIAADMGYAAEPHPDCRKPRICREFSHAGLCLDCRIAAGLETARAA